MSTQNIDTVRKHLFAALEGLADKETPMELDRAKAISEVAQTIINSAKVEIDFLKVAGRDDSRFLVSETTLIDSPDELPNGISSIVRHRIAG